MTTQTPAAARDYLARVRTALADLPVADLDEVLEDVRPHLVEIAEELGEDARVEAMIERLGSPESYAAELRAAGDFPPPGEVPAPGSEKKAKAGNLPARLAFWVLVLGAFGTLLIGYGVAIRMRDGVLGAFVLVIPALVLSLAWVVKRGLEPIAALPEVRWMISLFGKIRDGIRGPVLTYLRGLQPAWWVACGAILVVVGILLVRRSTTAVITMLLLVALGALAVWLGPKVRTDKRWLWFSLPVSALAVGSALGVLGHVIDTNYYYDSYPSSYQYQNQNPDGSPALSYGTESVENVYAFDAQGNPLSDIYLYDENGRPLAVTRYACEGDTGTKSKVGSDNRFPRPKIEQGTTDDRGNYNGYNGYRAVCKEIPGVPFTAAIPKAPAPSPAPTPAPTTAPQPTR